MLPLRSKPQTRYSFSKRALYERTTNICYKVYQEKDETTLRIKPCEEILNSFSNSGAISYYTASQNNLQI